MFQNNFNIFISPKGGMKREFHMPLQLETFQGDGGTLKTIVKNVVVFPLEVYVPGKTHGESNYDMNEFQRGTRQHVVTNKVAQNFNIPRLGHVGA
jgi:hypothetical protein